MQDDAGGTGLETMLRGLRAARGGLALLLVAAVAGAVAVYLRLPVPPGPPPAEPPVSPEWLSVPEASPAEWGAVFRGPGGDSAGDSAAAASADGRYRLAGIFITFGAGASSAAPYRKAILDDLQAKQQYLAGENEAAGDARVLKIREDRVLIEWGGRQEELRLTYAGGAEGSGTNAVPGHTAVIDGELAPLEITRYGKRVGETRWVMERDALKGYYQELLDNPERIAKLYETFKPEYRDDRIAGYQIDVKGEEDFLRNVGLRQGDVLRQVNSMNMTSQNRAEFFLGEFMKDRLGAVVLDVEREGKPQKLIYLMR